MKVSSPNSLTQAVIHLDRLTHNMRILQELVGTRPLWPAIKANAYGHGASIIARHLLSLGYETLCVARVTEAIELIAAGVEANYVLLSATLPVHSEAIVASGCEPAVCTNEMLEALAREAESQNREVSLHVMVDTGMGRIGIRPKEVPAFIEKCKGYPRLRLRGMMSHFPCADEKDKKQLSCNQLSLFKDTVKLTAESGIEVSHMANSAAIFEIPESHLDAARPGIAIYGLRPSAEIANPRVHELRPVLEWKSRITLLKEVPAGEGISYGHTFHTQRPSLIATLPVGYGDGLHRNLSNNCEMLVRGVRCPQVGRITMDQSMLDVTALRGEVALGDEVVIIGQQGSDEVSADELANKLGTINYEVVTAIARRVSRIVVGAGKAEKPMPGQPSD